MPNPGRDSEVFRCRVAAGTTDKIRAIALQLGFLWGNEPQVSAVVEAIGRHKEVIAPLLKKLEKSIDESGSFPLAILASLW